MAPPLAFRLTTCGMLQDVGGDRRCQTSSLCPCVPSAMGAATHAAMRASGGHLKASSPWNGQRIFTRNGVVNKMSNIRDAAQSLECSLMILRKDKDGWVFGFRVHPNDAPRSLLDASLGTRFQMVFFEIADDETFIVPEEVRKGVKAVSIAGQMCREEGFQGWMLEKAGIWKKEGMDVESVTADLLREYLNIESRAELKVDEGARDNFRSLIEDYRNESRDRR